jgi:hypothetical protein
LKYKIVNINKPGLAFMATFNFLRAAFGARKRKNAWFKGESASWGIRHDGYVSIDFHRLNAPLDVANG